MRGSLDDVEHRFFLALLLNVPDRDGILKMVAARHPGDALETILRWAGEFLTISDGGLWILDAEFPEGVDVDAEAGPDLFLAALRFFLAGGEIPDEIPEECVASLREAFVRSSWRVLLADG
jgi:hypothetical protein